MPNWCECDLTVKGDKLELERFSMAVSSVPPTVSEKQEVLNRMTNKPEPDWSPLDANQIIPYPEKFDENGFNNGGYEWCIENWGTKWNFVDVKKQIRARSIFYNFETAWSPPTPLMKKLSEMFPNLEITLKYYERGAGYSGVWHYKDGEIEDEQFDYRGRRGG